MKNKVQHYILEANAGVKEWRDGSVKYKLIGKNSQRKYSGAESFRVEKSRKIKGRAGIF